MLSVSHSAVASAACLHVASPSLRNTPSFFSQPAMSKKAAAKTSTKKTAKSASNSNSIMPETRVFKPDPAFAKKARIGSMAEYRKMHEESLKNPDKFFGREAKELLWQKPFTKVLEWKCPNAKWF